MSTLLWNFKEILAENQCAQMKPLYFVNTMNVSSSKIGRDLKDKVVQKWKLK